jgi:hypothetical protein
LKESQVRTVQQSHHCGIETFEPVASGE